MHPITISQAQFLLYFYKQFTRKLFKGGNLGWFKNPVSSQTKKLSDYLGVNHYKKAKKLKYFIHLDLAYWPQCLSTYHSILPTVNSGH